MRSPPRASHSQTLLSTIVTVVEISVKSMDEISVTIQIIAPKQDCPALGITNVFEYFTY